MIVLLLQGVFIGFLLVHLPGNKPWIFKLLIILAIASCLPAHITTAIQLDAFHLLLFLAGCHAAILSKLGKTMASWLLAALLMLLYSGLFIPIHIAFVLLALFAMTMLTIETVNRGSVIDWLILLGLVLCWLISAPTHWLLIACGCWAIWHAKQLHEQSNNNNHVDHPAFDDMYTQIEAVKVTERSRIYQNIHDDVGAELLKLIYQLEDSKLQNQVKNIMNQLRQAVASTAHINITAQQLLQEIATEAATRCSLANISFNHQIKLNTDTKLCHLEPIHLQRIIRELINNCLKHAEATHINMQATTQDNVLHILLSDDGIGFKVTAVQGKGVKSLQKRVAATGGTITWTAKHPQGTEVELALKI